MNLAELRHYRWKLEDRMDEIQRSEPMSNFTLPIYGMEGRQLARKSINKSNDRQKWYKQYFSEQDACLNMLDELKSKLNDTLNDFDGDLCVFAAGSCARLEFISSTSDLDCVAVCRDNSANYDNRKEWHEKLSETAMDFVGKEEVDLSGIEFAAVPILANDGFERLVYALGDLTQNHGKDYEAAWALTIRAMLQFDAIYLAGDENLADECEQKVSTKYCDPKRIAPDIFPYALHLLGNEVASTSLLNAVLSINDGPATGSADGHFIKFAASRLWNGYANEIIMHLRCWRSLTTDSPEDDWLSNRNLGSDFRGGILHKLLLTIPKCIKKDEGPIDDLESLVDEWLKRKNKVSKRDIKILGTIMQDVKHVIGFFSLSPKHESTDEEFERPIDTFLEAWKFGHDARKSSDATPSSIKDQIVSMTLKFSIVVTRARQATLELLSFSGSNVYSQYIALAWASQADAKLASQSKKARKSKPR